MPVRPTQSLVMPDGNEYEFFGKTYYGTCTTGSTVQAKTVTITGFNSNSLVNGARVVVKFSNAQLFNGAPTLNVSSTGAKTIKTSMFVDLGYGEWNSGAVIAFVYADGYWVIEDGAHATTSSYGKTMLNDSVNSFSSSTAATPYAVRNAYRSRPWGARDEEDIVYKGHGNNHRTIVNTTTPTAENWDDVGENKQVTISFSAEDASFIDEHYDTPRYLRANYGDFVWVNALDVQWPDDVVSKAFICDSNDDIYLTISTANKEIYLSVPENKAGAYPFKVEVFCDGSAGVVCSASLSDAAFSGKTSDLTNDAGFLTLSTLPIWDGTVT